MKRKLKIPFYIPALFLFIIIAALNYFSPKPLDWTPSWRKNDANPYGAKALFKLLPNYYKVSDIEVLNMAPNSTTLELDKITHYISIGSTQYSQTKYELKALETIANTGGTVFLSHESFSPNLLDTLELKSGNVFLDTLHNYSEVILNFTGKNLRSPAGYTLKSSECMNDFDSIPSTATVLARNNRGKPVLIQMPLGKGKLILSSTPYIFTNYFLFKDNNVDYIEKTFSFIGKADKIYWDEYYKTPILNEQSSLKVLLGNEGFKRAWYLSLILIGIFILFMSKRKQKSIPIIQAPINTSLEFTKTIGRLYFNQANHKNLTDKKINYFFEKVRLTYHISTENLDENFIHILSEKSGYSLEKTEILIKHIHQLKRATSVNEKTLQTLHSQMEDFEKVMNSYGNRSK